MKQIATMTNAEWNFLINELAQSKIHIVLDTQIIE